VKKLLTRIKLRYHEGRGPTMTLAQADACPDWAPLWVCSEPVRVFEAAKTFEGHPVEMLNLGYGEDQYVKEKNPSVFQHKADLLLPIPQSRVVSKRDQDFLKIVHATVPQRVTDQFPRARLLAAPHFRVMHGKGFFSIVTSAYAEEVLKDPNAQKTEAVLRDLQARINGTWGDR
jgi:hypothetical protein